MPPGLLTLLPAAVLAGFALALANGLVDIERDRASGRQGIVVALGAARAWLLHAGALGMVIVLALILAPNVSDPTGTAVLATLRSAGLPLGIGAIALGAAVLLARPARVRERGWELEAAGVAAAGIAWLAGAAASARPV